MPRRRRDDDDGGEAYRRHHHEKRPRPQAQQKHLYLVLDDWERGYSIHKLDVDDDAGVIHGMLDHDHDAGGGPAVRFAAPGSSCSMRFFPMRGGSIVMMSDAEPTLVYDTGAAALTIGSPLPGRLVGGLAIAMPRGERLYALTSLGERFPYAFEMLTPAGCCGWSWKNATAPPPPPFEKAVTAYAVHPDGHTVFVSISGDGDGDGGTYTLDTKRREWRWHGDWLLPFHGQGYFDAELDAWVGLGDTICACQVPSRSGGGDGGSRLPEWDTLDDDTVVPSWKKSRRRPGRRRATLTYMGDRKFCVVDSVECDGDDDDDGDGVAEPPQCDVHVAVFGLKYNRRGELQATARGATGSYRVPKHFSWFSPVAFWM